MLAGSKGERLILWHVNRCGRGTVIRFAGSDHRTV